MSSHRFKAFLTMLNPSLRMKPYYLERKQAAIRNKKVIQKGVAHAENNSINILSELSEYLCII